jgi:hypothetical protein
MIEKFSMDHINEHGLPPLCCTKNGVYYCAKVTSIHKIDIPYFGIEFKSDGQTVLWADYSSNPEDREEDFFRCRRILTY